MTSIHSIVTFPLLLLLFISSAAAIPGPNPNDVPPLSYKQPNLRRVSVPIQRSSCNRSGAPLVYSFSPWVDDYDCNVILAQAYINWCPNSDTRVRYRVLEYSGTPSNPITRVVAAFTQDYAWVVSANVFKRCQPYQIYAEVCVRHSKNARPACTTSELHTIDKAIVPEPRLKFRPPIELRLAPGDSARIVTKLDMERSPVGNVAKDRALAIGAKIVSQYGRVLKYTGLQPQTISSVSISESDSISQTKPFYNGALAYIVYAKASCLTNTASFKDLYATRITVNKSIKPLIKQDSSLPSFRQPLFTPIRSGDNATITVVARNTGGGMRMGGMPTELHYQWYTRPFNIFHLQTKPGRITGATSPTLKLESVVCEKPCYSEYNYQVTRLKEYYVDVCNTYGCKRSEKIVPRYISDDGSIITDESCEKIPDQTPS